MKRVLYIVISLTFIAQTAFAQGTDALPFTRIDRNPATSALAGAGSASNSTAAYSAFSNASMLPFYKGKLDAGVSLQMWAPSSAKSTNLTAGVAYKISKRVGLSLGYTFQNGASYDVQDYNGQVSGTFSPKSHIVVLGAGFGLGNHFSLGVNLRYAMQKPSADVSFNGFSGDVFLAYAVNDDLRLTAGVSTLGTSITSSNKKKFSQPTSAKLAAHWGITFAAVNRIELMADADYYFSKNFGAALGAQYAWNDTVFVRAGYRYASQYCVIPSHLGIGIGAKFYGFKIDLSYLTASKALGNTLCIGLGYSF